MKTNVLQEAIDKAVDAATSSLNKRLDALEKKIEGFDQQDLSEQVEVTIAQLLGNNSGRSSAKKKAKASSPARAAATAGAVEGDCGHKNSMSACANCRAKKAAAEAAA